MTSSQLSDIFKFIQQGFSSINGQGGFFTFYIGYTPNQREGGSWKELAEAHLRERVKNPHDYRALSIELEGMKNAGFPWEKEFNHNLSQMVRFINKLYQAKLVPSILWNRIESISDRHLYRIQEATDYWRNFRQFLR